jgi:RHS repeat-associated protein
VCGLVLRAQGQSDASPYRAADLKSKGIASATLPQDIPSAASFAPRRVPGEPGMVAPPSIPTPFRSPNSSLSLLNVDGQFAHEPALYEVDAWKRELHQGTSVSSRRAWLHIWVGEYELARNENPAQARWHFNRAKGLVPRNHDAYGLAAFDAALSIQFQADYIPAQNAFQEILVALPALKGFSHRACALWLRRAKTMVGYHQSAQRQGIPQPPKLDPLCGAAALANCLKSFGLPHDKQTVLSNCRVTGMGSSMEDLRQACAKFGLEGRVFRADEEGLRLLPKPFIAFVQHGHFVAVTAADTTGITYRCTSCGHWPGGEVRLTWKQWRVMEAGPFLTITKVGTPTQQALALVTEKTTPRGMEDAGHMGAQESNVVASHVADSRLTSARILHGPRVASSQATAGGQIAAQLAARLIPHTIAQLAPTFSTCGHAGRGYIAAAPPGANEFTVADPVNVATGEETQAPAPDLTVYNPNGPSVVWRRFYRSMQDGGNDGNRDDFGNGWSRSYNVLVYDSKVQNVKQVPLGVATQVPVFNTEAPGTGLDWDIVQDVGGTLTTLATSTSPNGWTVFKTNDYCRITSPIGASDSTGYTIRWKAVGSAPRSARFDLLGPYLLPQASQEVTMTPTGTTQPDNWVSGNYWQVVKSGTTVATLNDPQGWRVIVTADSKLKLTAPLGAAVGSDYEVRYRAYSYPAGYQNLSAPFSVVLSRLQPTLATKYIVMPDHARVAFTPSGIPTASQPEKVCSPARSGDPMRLVWHYDPNCPLGYYIVTFGDGSRWVMQPASPLQSTNSTVWINNLLRKIVDRMGHSITFNYGPAAQHGSYWIPTLSSIVDDASSVTLLSITRTTNGWGRVASVTDCYGRSVYYATPQVSITRTASPNPGSIPVNWLTQPLLVSVSQVVPTGTASPPMRWGYGYTSPTVHYWDAPAIEFLGSVTTPSPTGTGTATTTIGYNWSSQTSSRVTDPNGNHVDVYYVEANRTKVSHKTAGGTEVYAYTVGFNSDQNVTDVKDANGTVVSTSQYGDSACPTSPSRIIDAEGRDVEVTHDTFGHPVTTTDVLGNVTTYTWDYSVFPLGRLMQVQTQGRQPVTFTYYEPSGLVHTVTGPSPSGGTRTTTYTYDSLGNILTVTGPGNNAVSQITTTLNYTTDGVYSQNAAIGQPLSVTNNLGKSTHLRYDAQGRVVAAWDALGNRVDTTYNLVGQPVTATYPATGQTGVGRSYTLYEYQYQSQYAGGKLYRTSVYDESNVLFRQVTTTYDATGKPLSASGANQPFSQTYDAADRLKTITDGNGNTTTYTYNTVGNLTQVDLPGGDTVQYTSYTNSGRLLQSVDGNGAITNYVYAAASGALTDVEHPAATAYNVHLTYDGYGRLAGRTDAAGAQTFSYGELDELTGTATTYTGLASQVIGYSYHADGSRASMTTPGGTFTYQYDGAGRPSALTGPGGSAAWSYLDNGWLAAQQNGSVATDYTYNALGQLTQLINSVGGNPVSSFSGMAHDAAGNRLSLTASIPSAPTFSGTTSWAYSTRDEVLQEQTTRVGGYTSGFGYDDAGNPTNFKGTSRTFNIKNQLTGGSGLGAFVYDGNGNPTTYNGVAVTYSPHNKPIQFGTMLSAGYRGDGLRAWKQNGAGTRTYFLYDGLTPVVELDATGAVTAVNSFGPNGLLSRSSGGSTVYYAFDERGNTTQRVDGSGNVLTSHIADAYGVTAGTATTNDPYAGFGAKHGYYTDTETSLVLCTFRYYDPALGRWLTRDPIVYEGGLNLYAYCTGNPIGLMDPLGFCGTGSYDWRNILTDTRDFLSEGGSELTDTLIDFYSDYGTPGVVIGGTTATTVDLVTGMLHGYFNFGSGTGRWVGGGLKFDDLDGLGQDMALAAGTGLSIAGATPIRPVSRAGASPVGGPCFVAGTPVQMADGTIKPIEDVKAGDVVFARDEISQETRGKRVVRTFVKDHEGTILVFLTEGNRVQIIESTENHPFFVEGLGWTAAGKLEPGQQVASKMGVPTYVVRIERQPRKNVRVYNFEVEEFHTYFVGDVNGGILVHNDCTDEAAKIFKSRAAAGQNPGEIKNVTAPGKFKWPSTQEEYWYHDVLDVPGEGIIDTLTYGHKNPVPIEQWKVDFDIAAGFDGTGFSIGMWKINPGSGAPTKWTRLMRPRRK